MAPKLGSKAIAKSPSAKGALKALKTKADAYNSLSPSGKASVNRTVEQIFPEKSRFGACWRYWGGVCVGVFEVWVFGSWFVGVVGVLGLLELLMLK